MKSKAEIPISDSNKNEVILLSNFNMFLSPKRIRGQAI